MQMKRVLTFVLLLVSAVAEIDAEERIYTLGYQISQSSILRITGAGSGALVNDPFAPAPGSEKDIELKKRFPHFSDEAREIIKRFDLTVLPEMGGFIYFDGSAIYARVSKEEHSKIVSIMEIDGRDVDPVTESRIVEEIQRRKLSEDKQ